MAEFKRISQHGWHCFAKRKRGGRLSLNSGLYFRKASPTELEICWGENGDSGIVPILLSERDARLLAEALGSPYERVQEEPKALVKAPKKTKRGPAAARSVQIRKDFRRLFRVPLTPGESRESVRKKALGIPELSLNPWLIEMILSEHALFLENGRGRGAKKANFLDENLEAYDFSGINLTTARFRRAKVASCRFNGCNLSYVDFRGANIDKADFTGADTTGANFHGCTGTPIGLPGWKPQTPLPPRPNVWLESLRAWKPGGPRPPLANDRGGPKKRKKKPTGRKGKRG